MSNILNNVTCVITGANTGLPDCPVIPDKIVGAILVDKDFVFESADVATVAAFKTKLQALALAAYDSRIFPIGPFEEMADNSEEESVTTMGYGGKSVARDGKYDWTFKMTKGGMYLQKALRKFNGTSKRVLFIDDNNVIYGYNGTAGFTGFSLDFFYAKPWKANDGANAAAFHVRFALSKTKELVDDVAYVDFSEEVLDAVKGITDVLLSKVTSDSTSVTVKAVTAADGIDLYDTYDDEIAAAGAWLVTKAGVVVTPSSVTKVAGSKAWKITLSTPTGAHVFSLNTPAALDALNIGGPPANGFESDTLSHTF